MTELTMKQNSQALFDNIHNADHLKFWADHGSTDYQTIANFLEFNKKELSKIGGISETSVRLDKRIPKVLKERLEQIGNICSLVAEYFEGDPGKTALWFKSPNPTLGMISPRDMIRYGRYKKLTSFIVEARKSNQPNAA